MKMKMRKIIIIFVLVCFHFVEEMKLISQKRKVKDIIAIIIISN